MRVMVVGGTGTIGAAVCDALREAGHEAVAVGHSSGEHRVDLEDRESIDALYEAVGPVDAVVSCAGRSVFGAVGELDDDAYDVSIRSKLLGQIHLVRAGLERLPGGSFTLTSGTLSTDPDPGTAAVAMVGGALESWTKAAALDLDAHRVNVVSPGWVKETMEAMGVDPTPGVAAADVAATYLQAVEGDMSGETLVVT